MDYGELSIRPARPGDIAFLEEMLFEAVHWRPEQERPTLQEFESNPEFSKLMKGWGYRPGDKAVIAEIDGRSAGAAWYRLWTDEEHTYGFVDEKTPELGMGVRSALRGVGIGRELLRALIDEAYYEGYEQISLSVEPDNFSRKLYASEGFVKVGENDGAWTMVKKLQVDNGEV